MKLKAFIICYLVTFCSMLSFGLKAQESKGYNQMRQNFLQPPSTAKPTVYHWWLGGHVDTVRLKEEIRSFDEAGIAGFTIFEIGSRDTVQVGAGPEFLGDESLATIKVAVDEASKYGMEVGLNTASSWNAGGNWLTPQHAAKSIYQRKVNVRGGGKKKIKVPFPEIPEKDPRGRKRLISYGKDGKPLYSEEIAVLAIPLLADKALMDTSRIKDVSTFFDSNKEVLNWEVPEGEWKIVRYVSSNSGENLVLPSKYSAGPIVDHFDAEATAFHFNYIIDRLESKMGDLRQTALKNLYMASYEARGFNWTPTLPKEFQELNGYDIKKFLPILFEEVTLSQEATSAFKAGFQRTLSELMIKNFYMKSKEICNAHGLKNNSEAGGPGYPLHNVPVEPLKALGKGLDIPRGEFWINHHNFSEEGMDVLRVVKEVSSASHIYGLGMVEMEAFTTFQQWQEGPFEMKPMGDRAFAEGMNRVVVHGSTHNPEGTGNPGIVYHAGTHYNDKRVWWKKIRPFNEYLARISYVLQEADFKADVLYYYGDTIPNYGGHKRSRFNPGEGYDFELLNTEVLLGLKVKNGKVLNPRNGAEFSVLALTEEYEINPKVLVKLEQMTKNGAIITGPKPSRIAPERNMKNLPNMKGWLDSLWKPFNKQDFKSGNKAIYYNVSVGEILKALEVSPDFDYKDKGFYKLDYTHYQKDGMDFYFIVNTTDEWISRDLRFRQAGKTPELWNTENGSITAISIFEQTQDGITLPLTLAPYESTFVAFRNGNNQEHFTNILTNDIHPPMLRYGEYGLELWEEGEFEFVQNDKTSSLLNRANMKTIDGAWEVYFPEGWGAPEKAIFPELKSWTESEIEGVKFFSGTARYEKNFIHEMHASEFPEARVYLDLGDLSHVAEVWLNEKPIGITWAKPYRFDVTDALKPGINTLKIEVANTWSNRLTGDAVTGANFTKTHVEATVIKGIPKLRVPWKNAPLIPSGIFGPVTLTTVLPIAVPK
ncbi:glycosyl hydrolase [uncultured Cyclobacterium sp.]|uniref:glycosyl hydrolase n=1 Tax=uncultured Cyclobacterium sp. TaxID=453820 RepID=UPI0030EF0FCC